MASIKIKFRPSSIPSQEGTIYYQIIHDRKVRQITSDYHVFPSEWDADRAMVTAAYKSSRRSFILSIRERIRWDMERLNKIKGRLETDRISYTADDVIEEFNRYTQEYSLFNFTQGMIAKLKLNGKQRTAETYRSTLNSIKKFLNDEDMMLECVTSDLMERYEAWLRQRGVAPNTLSFYLRILRAVYNRAVEEEVVADRHPFRHVYTRIEKTVKRALPLQTIRTIKNLDLTGNPTLDYARDMFMLSFYLRGMSFIDMAFLRKIDLREGHVIYRRRKTGQQLTIEWTSEMQAILDKYPENKAEYLFPVIRTPGTNERCAYRNAGYNINHNLKKIGHMIGISIPLTLYVARHSWASGAKSKGIPLSVISEGMGHDNESTTQIYLASLDTSVEDNANSIIIQSLR